MKNICYIIGSPKNENSCSDYLSMEMSNLLTNDSEIIITKYFINDFRKNKDLYKNLIQNQIIIFLYPIYVDGLPAFMLEFLMEFSEFLKTVHTTDIKVYGIANCGFYEGHQNKISLKILENFCVKANLNWRFGIGIGSGPFVGISKNMPLNSKIKKPIYDAFLALKNDVENTNLNINKNLYIDLNFPRFIYLMSGNLMWFYFAKNNKIKFKKLWTKH